MLLKKKIILLNIKKKKLKTKLVYYSFKSYFTLLLCLFNCFLEKYKVVAPILKYSYHFKWNSRAFYIIEIKLNNLLDFFYYFNYLNILDSVKNVPRRKHLISLIRSPFVYKKSMEQFFYDTYKIDCQTNFLKYDFVLQNYQTYFLKKELNQNSIFKFFFKIIFK